VVSNISGDVLAEPAMFEVTTRDGGSQTILSALTDKGMDFTVGFSAYLRFRPYPLSILVPFGVEYSRAILRDYYVPFDAEGAKNRIGWHVAPGIALFDEFFSITVQNRFVYWWDRGFEYEITPALTLTTPFGLALSIGVGIPVSYGSLIRVIIDCKYNTPSLKRTD
jgi:hypothetical protein